MTTQGQIVEISTDNKAAKKFNGTWIVGQIGSRLHLYKLNSQHKLLNVDSVKNHCHMTADVLSNYIAAGWAQLSGQADFEQLCNELDAK